MATIYLEPSALLTWMFGERRAGRPFPHEPVRTLDAIHLATALECTRVYDDLVLASLDRRILKNAAALGLV